MRNKQDWETVRWDERESETSSTFGDVDIGCFDIGCFDISVR